MPDPTLVFLGMVGAFLVLYIVEPELLKNWVSRIVLAPLMFVVSTASVFWRKQAADVPHSGFSPFKVVLTEAERDIRRREEEVHRAEMRLAESERKLESIRQTLEARVSQGKDLAKDSSQARKGVEKTESRNSLQVLPIGSDTEAMQARREIEALHSHAAGDYGRHTKELRRKALLGESSSVAEVPLPAKKASEVNNKIQSSTEMKSFMFALIPRFAKRKQSQSFLIGRRNRRGESATRAQPGARVTPGGA
uniref:Uncharacterized protein n=1 Tax=Compsopogon caeruleus TaxID=31354 RepID=A0A7S1XF56_9RHOD|mmetsp:Transcript_3165/g.5997  ORF Transcript_3165/g.5997 Transcript_3165/m.5997 type:complete len:251 (+) Transcript_3165:143-895(+)